MVDINVLSESRNSRIERLRENIREKGVEL